jgi:hypothetical protein
MGPDLLGLHRLVRAFSGKVVIGFPSEKCDNEKKARAVSLSGFCETALA